MPGKLATFPEPEVPMADHRCCASTCRPRRCDTPREPRGPWVVPGTYTVRLTVEDVDALPTPAVRAAVEESVAALDAALAAEQEEKR